MLSDTEATTARPRPGHNMPQAVSDPMPHDAAAEQCIIGSLLLDADAWMARVAAAMPEPAAITGHIPRVIYAAMLQLHRSGQPVDGAMILSHLKAHGYTDLSGIYNYMDQAAQCVPSPSHVMGYVHVVFDLHRRRTTVSVLHKAQQGLLAGATVESVTTMATTALAGIVPHDEDEPLEQEIPTRMPFPVDCLPNPLAGYVRAIADSMGVDPALPATIVLGITAGCIGNSRAVQINDGWQEPVILWTVPLMESGELKTPVFKLLMKPLVQKQMQAEEEFQYRRQQHEMESACFEKKLSQWKRENNESDPPVCDLATPPEPVDIFTTEPTIEAVGRMSKNNPRGLLLVRDEGSGFLMAMNQYKSGGGSDVANWLELYTCGILKADRATKQRLVVPHASCSIATTCQPEVWRAHSRGHIVNGMFARFLASQPPSLKKRYHDGHIDPEVQADYGDAIERLLNLEMKPEGDSQRPYYIRLSTDALEQFKAFVDSHNAQRERLDDQGLQYAYAKLEGACARIAGVLHCISTNPDNLVISGDTMDAAVRLIEYFKNEARRIYIQFGRTPEETEQSELVRLIRDRFGGRVTPKQLWQSSRKYRPTEKAIAALEELIAGAYGKWEITTPDGVCKPKTEFVLMEAVTPVTVTLPPKIQEIT